jgi:hypothetical protein
MSNEINNLQQRERERLFIIVLFVTLLRAFAYEKLGSRFGSLAEVLMLKVLPGQGVSGGFSKTRTSVTYTHNTRSRHINPRKQGLPAITYP